MPTSTHRSPRGGSPRRSSCKPPPRRFGSVGPTVWYHGGPAIHDWRDLRWDRERSKSDLNAEGPGMYWTTDEEEAASYARGGGVLYRGEMLPGFRLLPRKRPTLATLRALYEQAGPERQEMFLSNWSIEMPASRSELDRALSPYSHQSTLFDAYVTLYHDLFQYDSDEYVAAMLALGYDGFVVERGTTGGSRRRKHLILWQPRAMQIEEA